MPRTKRPKPLYQRGEFRLYARAGRHHEIVWYDADAKRERSRSAGTSRKADAIIALDNLYVETHGGTRVCPTCLRPLDQRGEPVTALVANYLETRAASDAQHSRLAHVLDWLEATGRNDATAEQIDRQSAQHFRDWMRARIDRQRAPGTIENGLIALAAAMRMARVEPSFRPLPTKEVNRTPLYRADAQTIAAMFRYCLDPDSPTEAMRARHIRERQPLLRYLRAAVATWARPDAVHDISAAPERRQWLAEARALNLNPDGRTQTRKYRPTIPVARQFVPHLAGAQGFYVGVASVKSAWEAMANALGLPKDGEAGMKLIRRSVSHMARRIIGEERWTQGQMMLGHRRASTSDIYALPDPANLGLALAATEQIIDEIEAHCPGAYRTVTAVASAPRNGKAG